MGLRRGRETRIKWQRWIPAHASLQQTQFWNSEKKKLKSTFSRTRGQAFSWIKDERAGESSILLFTETWLLMLSFLSVNSRLRECFHGITQTCSKKATILHYRGALRLWNWVLTFNLKWDIQLSLYQESCFRSFKKLWDKKIRSHRAIVILDHREFPTVTDYYPFCRTITSISI